MQSLQDIVESGHSLLIVEHHSHVLAQADRILEMGPGSGKNGGQLIASEPPSKLAKLKDTDCHNSYEAYSCHTSSYDAPSYDTAIAV